MPSLSRQCVASWKKYNPNYNIILLDDTTISDYVDIEPFKGDFTSKSEILRVKLLEKFGGFWADATLCCNRPLDNWIEEYVQSGFFAFASAHKPRTISSWFLYSNPGTLLITTFSKSISQYWIDRSKKDEYFWFHHTFKNLCEINEDFSTEWSRVKRFDRDVSLLCSKNNPHLFAPCYIIGNIKCKKVVQKLKSQIDSQESPMYKLSNKMALNPRKGTAMDYLLQKDCHTPSNGDLNLIVIIILVLIVILGWRRHRLNY